MSGFMSGIIDRVKGDMHYLFKKGTDLTEGEKKRKLRAWSTVIGIVLVIVQLVFTVLTLLKLYKLDILPLKYAIILDVILVIIAIYNFASQFTKTHIIGKILAVLLERYLTGGDLNRVCRIALLKYLSENHLSERDRKIEVELLDTCIGQNLDFAFFRKFEEKLLRRS